MSRVIQQYPYIDLSKLKAGFTYIFYLRNGKKLKDKVEPRLAGGVCPYLLVKKGDRYTKSGHFHFTREEMSIDIVKIKLPKVKEPS